MAQRFRIGWPDALALLVLIGTALLLLMLGSTAPRATTFTLDTPQVVLPLGGFNKVEQWSDGRGSFRWTTAQSTLALPNPGGTPRVSIPMLSGPNGATPVQIESGDLRYAFDVLPQVRSYHILLPATTRERFTLTLRSPTVKDRIREIGVVVGDVTVRGDGRPALNAVLLLLGASVASYALLRQAGAGVTASAGAVLLAQGAVALWLAAGGWRYGLLGTLLAPLIIACAVAVALDRWLPARRVPADAGPAIRWRREWLVVAALLIVALGARALFLLAPDPAGDMEISARRMWLLHERGFGSAYAFEGDYLPLRLYMLGGLAELVPPLGGSYFAPLPAATKLLLKLPSLLADLATIPLIYVWARRWRSAGWAGGLAALYACAPPVWINVAWWGQVDALLMLPLLGTIMLLERAGGRWSWLCWAAALLIKAQLSQLSQPYQLVRLCWAVALLIKAQAVLLAPLLFVATLRLHGSRGLVQGGALAAGVLALASLPLLLAGQADGLLQAYLGSTERFPRVTIGAYNLWHLALGGEAIKDSGMLVGPLTYRMAGLLLLGTAALLICAALLRRSDRAMRATSAAALALAFFTLPTQIHERYLFLTLAFLALAAATDRRLIGLFVLLSATATLNILGTLDGFWPAARVDIAASPLPTLCAVLNLVALLALLGRVLWLAWAQHGMPARP